MSLKSLRSWVKETANGAVGRVRAEFELYAEIKRRRDAFIAEYRDRASREAIPRRPVDYIEYLHSEWWKHIRNHSLSYLGNKCEFCAQPAIQLHHVRYLPRSDRGLEGIELLYAVCKSCHDIAHGFNGRQPTSECAFCHGSATRILKIAICKHDNPLQHVCDRCYAMARGHRAKANGWSMSKYRTWILDWYVTMPKV